MSEHPAKDGNASDATKRRFEIGLSMSGAISAGAYTAGVIDFLIQALDEWERAKARPDETLPKHDVGIKVLAGASAGAVTAAIATVALASDQKPVELSREDRDKIFEEETEANEQTIKCYLPKLYTAWVVNPSLLPRLDEQGQRAGLGFLDPCDLEPEPERAPRPDLPDYSRIQVKLEAEPTVASPFVKSVLNTRVLDETVHEVLQGVPIQTPKAYIAEPLHVFMTLGNLRGLPYKVTFGHKAYGMMTHGDYVHHRVTGLGIWPSKSRFADNDYPVELSTKELFDPGAKWRWRNFAIYSLASSAFPIGLSPRMTGLARADYKRRLLPLESLFEHQIRAIEGQCPNPLSPQWPDGLFPADATDDTFYMGATIDGGVINNDPFEFARFTLRKDGDAAGERGSGDDAVEGKQTLSQRNERDKYKADRAVIMIAPFPEPPAVLSDGKPQIDIISILRALIPAWKNQARFKPDELILALDPQIGSRFIISPERDAGVGKSASSSGESAIASGVLGGFGGFLDRAFRDHDYQLGRRNCQQFLRVFFSLPVKNEVFGGWTPPESRTGLTATGSGHGEATLCLIPLFGTAMPDIPQPRWPQMPQAAFKEFLKHTENRIQVVLRKTINDSVEFRLANMLLRGALRLQVRDVGIRPWFMKKLRLAIESQLLLRNQIAFANVEVGRATDASTRAVLSELLNPNYDLRTVKGIAASTKRSENDVKEILKKCSDERYAPYNVWETPWTLDGVILYSSASRMPPKWRAWINGYLGRDRTGPLFSAPSIN